MKKFLLLAALSATTFFTSCNSNDDDSDSTKTSKELLVGTWKIKSSGFIVDGIDKPDTLVSCDFQTNFTLKEDNKFTQNFYESDGIEGGVCYENHSSGTWSLNGNNLTLKEDNDEDSDDPVTVEFISKDEMKFSYFDTEFNDTEYYVYTRAN